MKTLFLLRHAKSNWDDPALEDWQRPLSKRGRAACELLARYMQDHGARPDLVLCSTAVRTRETCARLIESWPDSPRVSFDADLYLADTGYLLTAIHQVDDSNQSLMLIGHNPGLESLVALLAGHGAAASRHPSAEKFPTAALATLSFAAGTWRGVQPRAGTLVSLVTPRSLKGE